MGEKEDWLCLCGHKKSDHRRNGRCKKCDCTSYSMAPHDHSKCHCIQCLRKEINEIKKSLRIIDTHLPNLLTFKDKTENILEEDLLPFKESVEKASATILNKK